jgi:predicted amidophosphoribosyltransferase
MDHMEETHKQAEAERKAKPDSYPTCPYCRLEIQADQPVCPHCGKSLD